MQPAEKARLMAKGQRLYDRCIAKNDQQCVIGFVAYELQRAHQELIADYLAWLQAQRAALAAGDAPAYQVAQTDALIAAIGRRMERDSAQK